MRELALYHFRCPAGLVVRISHAAVAVETRTRQGDLVPAPPFPTGLSYVPSKTHDI